MYLGFLSVYADEEIVDRFRSGFVHRFHTESCCITELCQVLLYRKLKTPDTRKVHVEFTDRAGTAPALRQLLDVADARWYFPFADYVGKDEVGKKQMILDALHAVLVWIGKQRGWDTAVFDGCREEALRRDLTLTGWSKQSSLSPNRRYRARVGFRYGLSVIEFYVAVFDRRGREVGRKPLGTACPEMGSAYYILKGKGEWLRSNSFRLLLPSFMFGMPKWWEVSLSELVT